MRTFVLALRTLTATAVVCTSMLVVMSDQGEDREPWEFVPVQTSK